MTNAIPFPKIDVNVLYISDNEFEELVLALLRLKDYVGLKQISFIAEEEICSTWESSRGKNISEVREILGKNVQNSLDKMLMLCCLLIQYDTMIPLDPIISNLYTIYQIGAKRELGFDAEKEHLSSSVIWKEVIARIYALGALAVFFEKFEAVPTFITKSWPKERPEEVQIPRFWARHALTMLRKEGRLEHPSLCLLAEEKVLQNDWLFKRFKKSLDLFRNSVCQFDFLQCIHAIHRTGNVEDAFQSFGIFHNYRAEPIVLDLISKGKSRRCIPELTDKELAVIIASLDGFAARAFSSYSDKWFQNDWRDKKIIEFLKKNLA